MSELCSALTVSYRVKTFHTEIKCTHQRYLWPSVKMQLCCLCPENIHMIIILKSDPNYIKRNEKKTPERLEDKRSTKED